MRRLLLRPLTRTMAGSRSALASAPGVLEAAVLAVPDEVMGEKVGAVLYGGQETVEVDKVLASKGGGEYDRVVGMLKDLRDLAEHEGRLDEALARIRALRDRYHSRKALLDRMDRAGLKG